MTDLLAHRGPDGRRVFLDGALGLGHRRLSILDLTAAGDQPMRSADGRVVITYNGETYNHASLRRPLEADGVRFRSRSDTETIIYHYARHGVRAFGDLDGIFAFALWDAGEQALFIVRDPLGVKPLYYWNDGERFAFASEAKALLLHPRVRREPDLEAVGEYIHFHSTTDGRTFFRDIRLLPPGNFVRVDRNGLCEQRYVPADDYSSLKLSEHETAIELQRTIESVIDSQLMSDVPVGCFVSGGIDSSIVAKYTRKFSTRESFRAFGCFYDGPNTVNEEPYAREVCKAFDISLSATHPSAADYTALFELASWHMDEPRIGPAMLSLWKVAELASHHVKVCLGGQGADELFGGYPRYAVAAPLRLLMRHLRSIVERRRSGIRPTLQKQIRRGGNAARLLRVFLPPHDWRRRYFNAVAQIQERTLRQLIPDHIINDRSRYFATFARVLQQCPSDDPIDRVMYWDRTVYLPGLFAQDDRMSMAHGVETRVPLADPRVVRLALRIPNSSKLKGLASKWILKQALAGDIPEWVLNRQKGGFETPAGTWFEHGAEMTRDLLAGPTTRQRGLFDTVNTAGLLGDMTPPNEVVIWKLISIEQWFRTFIDTAPRDWQFARMRTAHGA